MLSADSPMSSSSMLKATAACQADIDRQLMPPPDPQSDRRPRTSSRGSRRRCGRRKCSSSSTDQLPGDDSSVHSDDQEGLPADSSSTTIPSGDVPGGRQLRTRRGRHRSASSTTPDSSCERIALSVSATLDSSTESSAGELSLNNSVGSRRVASKRCQTRSRRKARVVTSHAENIPADLSVTSQTLSVSVNSSANSSLVDTPDTKNCYVDSSRPNSSPSESHKQKRSRRNVAGRSNKENIPNDASRLSPSSRLSAKLRDSSENPTDHTNVKEPVVLFTDERAPSLKRGNVLAPSRSISNYSRQYASTDLNSTAAFRRWLLERHSTHSPGQDSSVLFRSDYYLSTMCIGDQETEDSVSHDVSTDPDGDSTLQRLNNFLDSSSLSLYQMQVLSEECEHTDRTTRAGKKRFSVPVSRSAIQQLGADGLLLFRKELDMYLSYMTFDEASQMSEMNGVSLVDVPEASSQHIDKSLVLDRSSRIFEIPDCTESVLRDVSASSESTLVNADESVCEDNTIHHSCDPSEQLSDGLVELKLSSESSITNHAESVTGSHMSEKSRTICESEQAETAPSQQLSNHSLIVTSDYNRRTPSSDSLTCNTSGIDSNGHTVDSPQLKVAQSSIVADRELVEADLSQLKLTQSADVIADRESVSGELFQLKLTQSADVVTDRELVEADLSQLKLTQSADVIADRESVSGELFQLKLTQSADVTDGELVEADLSQLKLTQFADVVTDRESVSGELSQLKLTQSADVVTDRQSVSIDLSQLKLTHSADVVTDRESVSGELSQMTLVGSVVDGDSAAINTFDLSQLQLTPAPKTAANALINELRPAHRCNNVSVTMPNRVSDDVSVRGDVAMPRLSIVTGSLRTADGMSDTLMSADQFADDGDVIADPILSSTRLVRAVSSPTGGETITAPLLSSTRVSRPFSDDETVSTPLLSSTRVPGPPPSLPDDVRTSASLPNSTRISEPLPSLPGDETFTAPVLSSTRVSRPSPSIRDDQTFSAPLLCSTRISQPPPSLPDDDTFTAPVLSGTRVSRLPLSLHDDQTFSAPLLSSTRLVRAASPSVGSAESAVSYHGRPQDGTLVGASNDDSIASSQSDRVLSTVNQLQLESSDRGASSVSNTPNGSDTTTLPVNGLPEMEVAQECPDRAQCTNDESRLPCSDSVNTSHGKSGTATCSDIGSVSGKSTLNGSNRCEVSHGESIIEVPTGPPNSNSEIIVNNSAEPLNSSTKLTIDNSAQLLNSNKSSILDNSVEPLNASRKCNVQNSTEGPNSICEIVVDQSNSENVSNYESAITTVCAGISNHTIEISAADGEAEFDKLLQRSASVLTMSVPQLSMTSSSRLSRAARREPKQNNTAENQCPSPGTVEVKSPGGASDTSHLQMLPPSDSDTPSACNHTTVSSCLSPSSSMVSRLIGERLQTFGESTLDPRCSSQREPAVTALGSCSSEVLARLSLMEPSKAEFDILESSETTICDDNKNDATGIHPVNSSKFNRRATILSGNVLSSQRDPSGGNNVTRLDDLSFNVVSSTVLAEPDADSPGTDLTDGQGGDDTLTHTKSSLKSTFIGDLTRVQIRALEVSSVLQEAPVSAADSSRIDRAVTRSASRRGNHHQQQLSATTVTPSSCASANYSAASDCRVLRPVTVLRDDSCTALSQYTAVNSVSMAARRPDPDYSLTADPADLPYSWLRGQSLAARSHPTSPLTAATPNMVAAEAGASTVVCGRGDGSGLQNQDQTRTNLLSDTPDASSTRVTASTSRTGSCSVTDRSADNAVVTKEIPGVVIQDFSAVSSSSGPNIVSAADNGEISDGDNSADGGDDTGECIDNEDVIVEDEHVSCHHHSDATLCNPSSFHGNETCSGDTSASFSIYSDEGGAAEDHVTGEIECARTLYSSDDKENQWQSDTESEHSDIADPATYKSLLSASVLAEIGASPMAGATPAVRGPRRIRAPAVVSSPVTRMRASPMVRRRKNPPSLRQRVLGISQALVKLSFRRHLAPLRFKYRALDECVEADGRIVDQLFRTYFRVSCGGSCTRNCTDTISPTTSCSCPPDLRRLLQLPKQLGLIHSANQLMDAICTHLPAEEQRELLGPHTNLPLHVIDQCP